MPEDLELVDVDFRDRKLIDRFIRVPWYVYTEHHPSPHWVPPLIVDRRAFLTPDKNPFFEHASCKLWLARSGGRDVGRIAAIDAVNSDPNRIVIGESRHSSNQCADQAWLPCWTASTVAP